MKLTTPKWRNWQTRYVQGVVLITGVWVRLPPSAQQAQANTPPGLFVAHQLVAAQPHLCYGYAMNESNHPAPKRRPRQQISSLQIVFAAILSIGLLLVINLSGRIARGQQMDNERVRLQATIDVLETQRADLLQDRDYAANDSSIEDWAHSDGKMVRDGEILVVPVPAGGTDAPATTPTPPPIMASQPTEPETPHWHLWWNLFFDGEPPF
jgi:cell division protein FtsB